MSLKCELQYANLKIQVLEERLRKQRIDKYGPSSENLSNLQLDLLEGEPGVSNQEVQAEAGRDQNVEAKPQNKRRPHPGRQQLPANLPRVERIIEVKAEECGCKACGKATTVIGYDESEQLEVKPASYYVLVTKREKRACPHCTEGGVKTAPVETRIIDKSLVSDRIILDTVVSKYSDHLPLYRQSVILSREAGIDVSRATMDGWVMRVGELLIPVTKAMRLDLISGTYIQADETTVDVQVPNGNGSNHQAYLWQYGKPGGETVFEFRMGRDGDGPKTFLKDYGGILQTDGYAGYNHVGAIGMVHAACWAHSRRKFVDALKLNPLAQELKAHLDKTARQLVQRMDELFSIDALARERAYTHKQRDELRQEKAAPLLVAMEKELKAASLAALPSSALGKAANYTISLWGKLNNFLKHPEIELSNNLAENSMRGVALGRKNWIHIGSEKAGPKVAAIISVMESCRRLSVPVRDYLGDVLPGMADVRIKSVGELTPGKWAAKKRNG